MLGIIYSNLTALSKFRCTTVDTHFSAQSNSIIRCPTVYRCQHCKLFEILLKNNKTCTSGRVGYNHCGILFAVTFLLRMPGDPTPLSLNVTDSQAHATNVTHVIVVMSTEHQHKHDKPLASSNHDLRPQTKCNHNFY